MRDHIVSLSTALLEKLIIIDSRTIVNLMYVSHIEFCHWDLIQYGRKVVFTMKDGSKFEIHCKSDDDAEGIIYGIQSCILYENDKNIIQILPDPQDK